MLGFDPAEEVRSEEAPAVTVAAVSGLCAISPGGIAFWRGCLPLAPPRSLSLRGVGVFSHLLKVMFIDALTYPVRRNGWVMILVGAIFSVILDVLKFAPVMGTLVAVFSVGYFGAFYLEIVGTTMIGRDEVPDWPSFSSFWDDIISPFVRLLLLIVFSFGPVMAIAIFADDEALWFGPAIIGAIIFGCFYFPMAVLATQAFGGIGAALPQIVLPAVFKALPGYLSALGALVLVFGVCAFAQYFTAKIPFVGWFLTAAVALYGLMFQGRLIGLIYIEKQDKLGWG